MRYFISFMLIFLGGLVLSSMISPYQELHIGDYVKLNNSECKGFINSINRRIKGDQDPTFDIFIKNCYVPLDSRNQDETVYLTTGILSVRVDRLTLLKHDIKD